MWVSVVWIATAVHLRVGETIRLTAEPTVEAWCGGNVTLTCDVAIADPGGIKLFQWIGNNKICEQRQDYADHKVVCRSGPTSLSLTVLNVMPADQGTYLCKVRSKTGVSSTQTVLTIPRCFDPPVLLVNRSQAACCFSGVHPRGSIHWFQGAVNLTDSAARRPDVQDPDGRYDVCSTLPTSRGNLSLPYTCLLWSPANGSYLFSVRKRYDPPSAGRHVLIGGTGSPRANPIVVLIVAAAVMKGLSKD